ncbi:MAG TPA: YceI family protein [Phnomibacter sp.]|nr:YceI family protein [Phnomibacter sp.]
MKEKLRKGLKPLITCAFLTGGLFIMNSAQAQKVYRLASNQMVIDGTSNIHDWTMKSASATGSASLVSNAANAVVELTNVSFSVPVETLKSDKSGLDKNAYKALKSDKFKSISFTGAKATLKPTGTNTYTITSAGKLTISGVTKDVVLIAGAAMNGDNSLHIVGAYKLKMTDFSVEPPSLMMGAIKTANEITFKYDIVFKP